MHTTSLHVHAPSTAGAKGRAAPAAPPTYSDGAQKEARSSEDKREFTQKTAAVAGQAIQRRGRAANVDFAEAQSGVAIAASRRHGGTIQLPFQLRCGG